jgi:hypothetical protein
MKSCAWTDIFLGLALQQPNPPLDRIAAKGDDGQYWLSNNIFSKYEKAVGVSHRGALAAVMVRRTVCPIAT